MSRPKRTYRKRAWLDRRLRVAAQAIAAGCTQAEAIRIAGIAPRTFYNRYARALQTRTVDAA